MNNIVIFDIVFVIENYNIVLDKSSTILKHKFCHSNNLFEELNKSKEIISKIKNCTELCTIINSSYKQYRCLEFIDDIRFTNELKIEIYNSLSNNVTKNIFALEDINYLKKLYITKNETIKNYEQESSYNYKSNKERELQRAKLLKFKN